MNDTSDKAIQSEGDEGKNAVELTGWLSVHIMPDRTVWEVGDTNLRDAIAPLYVGTDDMTLDNYGEVRVRVERLNGPPLREDETK